GGQLDPLAVAVHNTGPGVQFDIAYTDFFGHGKDGVFVVPIFGPAENGPGTRNKLAGIEWLCQVVVCTHFKPNDAIDFFITSRQHKDRRIQLRTQMLQDLKTTHTRKHYIEYDQVVFARFGDGQSQSLLAVVNRSDLEAFR